MESIHTPGIYIKEISSGAKPIQSVSTTTCGFIGDAPLKDAFKNEPKACNNFEEFCRNFVPDRYAEKDKLAAMTSSQQDLVNAVYGFFMNGGTRCYVVNVAGGAVSGDGKKTGIHSLTSYDEIALVAAPGKSSIDDYNALIEHCETLKNRFAILDGPATFDDVSEMTKVGIDLAPAGADSDSSSSKAKKAGKRAKASSYAAQYIPHLRVKSPLTGETVNCPPSGHMAGIYARTDTDRGVHKAPANIGIRACSGLTQRITAQEQGQLNFRMINCIRYFPDSGIRVWGARTLSDDPEWRYINVRRLFLMIEQSIKFGTGWVVFEPNDTMLYQSVIRDISAYLTLQWRSGALVGSSPSEAFFVKCDGENNPVESVDAGYLNVDIGIAPSKPAEFIIFRIGQWQGGSEGTAEG